MNILLVGMGCLRSPEARRRHRRRSRSPSWARTSRPWGPQQWGPQHRWFLRPPAKVRYKPISFGWHVSEKSVRGSTHQGVLLVEGLVAELNREGSNTRPHGGLTLPVASCHYGEQVRCIVATWSLELVLYPSLLDFHWMPGLLG